MADATETSISIPTPLLNRAKALADRLQMPLDQLLEMAIEDFSNRADQIAKHESQIAVIQQVINQGDLYWVQPEGITGSEPAIRHPYVVVQDDLLNHSRIQTIVMCALTSNPSRAAYPGNVLLHAGEANLPKHSVVEVSKISTVNKAQLGDYIGTLSQQRIQQILEGLRFLQTSFFNR